MTRYSRRSLLGSFGTLALVAAFDKIGLGRTAIPVLPSADRMVDIPPGSALVFFEGPWLFYQQDSTGGRQVVAVTAIVPGHQYSAGLWIPGQTPDEFNLANPFTKRQSVVTVSNAQPVATTAFDALLSGWAPYFPDSEHSFVPPAANSSLIALTVTVPVPDQIVPDAYVQGSSFGGSDIGGLKGCSANNAQCLMNAPTTFAFVYRALAASSVGMTVDGIPVGGSNSIHYHYHAYPQGIPALGSRSHAIMAFGNLTKLVLRKNDLKTPLNLSFDPVLEDPTISCTNTFNAQEAGCRPVLPNGSTIIPRAMNLSNCAGSGLFYDGK